MRFALFLLTFASMTTLEVEGDQLRRHYHWAVLVAGSNEWYNYRHQADICHAYQILIKNGMPPERIITMMYDDIAYNEENPFPGKIFNTNEFIDVYEGVKIDYRGDEVSPENFIGILLGDREMKKKGFKVLERSSALYVYNKWSVVGYCQSIHHVSKEWHRLDIQTRIDKLIVFATTSANSHEASFGAFCYGKVIHTCLADEYSINWMLDSENKMQNLIIGTFQGQVTKPRSDKSNVIQVNDFVDSHKVHIHYLRRKLKSTNNTEDAKVILDKLSRALKLAEMVDRSFDLIGQRVKASKTSSSMDGVISIDDAMDCYESAVKRYTSGCFTIQKVPEVAQHLNELWTYCKTGYDVEKILKAITYVCH